MSKDADVFTVPLLVASQQDTTILLAAKKAGPQPHFGMG